MASQNPDGMETVAENLHFTYQRPAGSELQQGDLLRKTERINSILEIAHPHYRKEGYSHLIVLTQSCDLARRAGQRCRARYISLAAVRPLRVAVTRELERYQDAFERRGDICRKGKKQLLEQFVEHVFNNNEPAYFYLHPQPELGFPEASCAFLRLSIPIRSQEHYEACLEARILSLGDVFQAKLGWLVGNLYSRVGTDDWVPKYMDAATMAQQVSLLLDSLCQWVEDDQLRAAKKLLAGKAAGADLATIRESIKSVPKRSKRDVILERVCSVLKEQGLVDKDYLLENLKMRLKNDAEFASTTK